MKRDDLINSLQVLFTGITFIQAMLNSRTLAVRNNLVSDIQSIFSAHPRKIYDHIVPNANKILRGWFHLYVFYTSYCHTNIWYSCYASTLPVILCL